MKLFSALFCLLLFTGNPVLFAQSNSGREAAAQSSGPDGTAASREEFLQATAYLFAHPADADKAARKQKMAFVTAWIVNSPDVSLTINANVINYFEGDGDAGLVILYMAAWSRHILQTGDTSAVNGNVKGMRAVLAYYKNRANHVKQLKALDQLLKKEEEGTLDAYLTERFKDMAE